MSLKIKTTLNFVKIWPLESRREEFSLTVISGSQEEANEMASNMIDSTICIHKNNEQQITYQVYFKSQNSEKSFLASTFDATPFDRELSKVEVLDYIIDNGLRLVPTPLAWETANGEPAPFVTHDVYVGKTRYQGMSVVDIVNSIVNGKAQEVTE